MSRSPAVAVQTDVARYPELVGKRVLIAGAERSFGLAIARAFQRHQAHLVLQANRPSNASRIGGKARLFECRPRSNDEIERLADAAVTAHGGLDIAIAVTALPERWQDLLSADPEAPAIQALTFPCLAGWRIAERMRVKNIRGCLVTVALLPAGGDRGAGRTLLGSALATLVRRQSRDLAPFGIRAYGIAAEPLFASIKGRGRNEPRIARTGQSRAVAKTALALASNRARFLSGQTLTI
jgi:NAD(P)-dependent dehydrogenase (short-subunit alcohol dehydrogenase family)